MKLLPPKQLNEKIQEQKASEVKAGLFLAKKVDALREELADVQKLHDESIENLNKEMAVFLGEKSAEKDSLIKEIEGLKEQKRILQIPLDNEWAEVRKEALVNETRKQHVMDKEFELTSKEMSLHEKESNILKRENDVKDLEIITNKNLKVAQTEYQETHDLLLNAQENEKQIKENLKVRTKTVEKRETGIAYREIDVENRMKHALAKEEANRKETLHIESKQRQLQTAFAELERKKHGTNDTTNK